MHLNESIQSQDIKLFSDVWSVFKNSLVESSIIEHENVVQYFFNSECYRLEGITYFCIVFEYRLNYEIDHEEYEHSEQVTCQFRSNKIVSLEKEELHTGCEYTNNICSLEQMFTNVERWKAYQVFKGEELEFDVYAEEI
jgi:hypothetical protein